MSIAVVITDRDTTDLCAHLAHLLPNVPIQTYPDITEPETVRLAVLWAHPPGITQAMPNLKAVTSMGAGTDHLDQDPAIDQTLRCARIVTPVLRQNMAQYVLLYVLADHRHLLAYQNQQQHNHWQVLETDEPMPTVGFLGLGELAGFVADQCRALGFRTMAWTRSQQHPDHPCLHGEAGLKQVCQRSDYLVVLLPLNKQTSGLINQQTLSWCKPEAMLINVARGAHVVEADLLQALDAGQIRHAVLDVFATEPLPTDHPFWQHPKITLTPHSSARSDVAQTAQAIAAQYRALSED